MCLRKNIGETDGTWHTFHTTIFFILTQLGSAFENWRDRNLIISEIFWKFLVNYDHFTGNLADIP